MIRSVLSSLRLTKSMLNLELAVKTTRINVILDKLEISKH